MSDAFFSALTERFRVLEQRLGALGGASRPAEQSMRFTPETFA